MAERTLNTLFLQTKRGGAEQAGERLKACQVRTMPELSQAKSISIYSKRYDGISRKERAKNSYS